MKKNPERQVDILRTKIIEKYNVKVKLFRVSKEVIIEKENNDLVRLSYEDTDKLIQILNDIYTNGSYMKGGAV